MEGKWRQMYADSHIKHGSSSLFSFISSCGYLKVGFI